MLKIISVFSMIILSLLALCSCSLSKGNSAPKPSPSEPSPDTDTTEECWNPEVPCVYFDDIVYEEPDVQKLISLSENTEVLIRENGVSAEEQYAAVEKCLREYSNFETMRSYSEISFFKNRSDEVSREKFSALHEITPAAEYSLDNMLFALKESIHCEFLEDRLRSAGIYREPFYPDKLSEDALKILENEAKAEVFLMSLCPETVKISYKGASGTLGELEGYFIDKFGKESAEYTEAMALCREKYELKYTECYNVTSIEIFKMRCRFAEALGYESYSDYLFAVGEYPSEDMIKLFCDNVESYILPVYNELNGVFERYFYSHAPTPLDTSRAINLLGGLYGSLDNELGLDFSHMISGGLYFIEDGRSPSRSGGRSSYLSDYNAPFVFIGCNGDLVDYTVIAGSFGNFSARHNKSFECDESLCLFSEAGIKMLTLALLSENIGEEDYKQLLYSELDSVLEDIIFKSYYFRLEEIIYSLPYEKIEKNNLERIAKELAEQMGISLPNFGRDHTEALVLTPFKSSVEAIASAVGLEVFSQEQREFKAGLGLCKNLLNLSCNDGFESIFNSTGIASPFKSEQMKSLSDGIHFLINGCHYFTESENTPEKT